MNRRDQRVHTLDSKALKSIIERQVLKLAIEALSCAETSVSAGGEQRPLILRKVKTPIGQMRVHCTSGLICEKAGRLIIPMANLLALPFADESELTEAFKSIFGSDRTGSLVEEFGENFTRALGELHEQKLPEDLEELHIGTISLTKPQGMEQNLILDYCIAHSQDNRPRIIGLWDPQDFADSRWENLREELEKRGLKRVKFLRAKGEEDSIRNAFANISQEKDFILCGKSYVSASEAGSKNQTIYLTEVITEDLDGSQAIEEVLYTAGLGSSLRRQSITIPAFAFAALTCLVLFSGIYRSSGEATFSLSQDALASAYTGNRSVVEADDTPMLEKQLAAQLSNEKLSSEARKELINIAQVSHSPEITYALLNLATSEDFTVRIAVAKALGNTSEKNETHRTAGLHRLLQDKDYLVRGFAARSLLKINSAEARAILSYHLAGESNQLVRSLIEKAIAPS